MEAVYEHDELLSVLRPGKPPSAIWRTELLAYLRENTNYHDSNVSGALFELQYWGAIAVTYPNNKLPSIRRTGLGILWWLGLTPPEFALDYRPGTIIDNA